MRIAIVNDTLPAVEAMKRAVAGVEGHEIAWVAHNGAKAVEKCSQDTPDLILMDLAMPVLDGVEATRRIMQDTPCAVLVVTENIRNNATKVFEAMGFGALDAVETPVLGPDRQIAGADVFLQKIATVGKLIGKPTGRPMKKQRTDPPLLMPPRVPPLLAIGASTGGPPALLEVLSCLPATFPAAVVVVQHLDVKFAPGLASWLDERTPLTVQPAREGARPEAGTVWVAATNDHLILTSELTLHYTPDPRECPYRPSVDVFFKSVAEHWPRKAAAVLLTGMGRDGAEGLLALRRGGWHTIVQDKESSAIYGMPKAAAELGAAVDVLPLNRIGPALVRLLTNGGPDSQRRPL